MTQLNQESKFVQFKKWFFESEIKIVQGIPFAVAGAFFIIWPTFVRLLGGEAMSKVYGHVHLPYVAFILSLVGVIGILRREFYWSPYITLQGGKAVFVGMFLTLLLITIGISLLVL